MSNRRRRYRPQAVTIPVEPVCEYLTEGHDPLASWSEKSKCGADAVGVYVVLHPATPEKGPMPYSWCLDHGHLLARDLMNQGFDLLLAEAICDGDCQ